MTEVTSPHDAPPPGPSAAFTSRLGTPEAAPLRRAATLLAIGAVTALLMGVGGSWFVGIFSGAVFAALAGAVLIPDSGPAPAWSPLVRPLSGKRPPADAAPAVEAGTDDPAAAEGSVEEPAVEAG